MRKLEGTMLTTHADLDGERMAPKGLDSFAASVNENYLPFTVEHDIRKAPIGRVASAAVVPLADGEFAVRGVFEVFEEGDTLSSLRGDGRRIRVDRNDVSTFYVKCDRSYETAEGREFLAALRRLSPDSHVTLQVKKSADPISTLFIAAGVFVGTSIAAGFFARLGEDLYVSLKRLLKTHFGCHSEQRERLLVFQFTTAVGADLAEVQVVLTNPTPEEIDALFLRGFSDLDSYLSRCAGLDSAARFVFEYKDGRLESLYVLRSDCVPLRLRRVPDSN